MATAPVRTRLADDVGTWLTDGLVRAEQADHLRQRWDQPGLGAGQVMKWLGYAGALMAMAGLLGLAAALSGSKAVAALELLAAGAAGLAFGLRLLRDPLGRSPRSGGLLVALGFFSASLGVGLAADALGLESRAAVVATGLVCVPAALAAAYRLRNTLVLVLGVLALFHWVGSWTGMVGRSTYEVDVQDPRLMALVAAAAAAFGALHPRLLPRAHPSFATAWAAVALTYCNLSLLILTVEHRGFAEAWIAVWVAAGVAQLVAGARLHRAVFTGFGVTALALNLFTRYFEHFWDALDAGLFILGAGAAAFAAGLALERLWRRSAGS